MESIDPPPSSRLAPRPEERVGTVLPGGFTLEAPIGSGGMATVFRARAPGGEAVAVKLLHPQVADDAEACKRFAFEVRAVRGLEHAAAARVFDTGVSDDGLPFMVMELLEGMTLLARMKHGPPLERDELLAVVDTLLDVLATAHERGVIHRDVKPANVFLTSEGRVKLLDFGIAKLQSVQRSVHTAPGSTLGTLGYMAPEQVHGRADARSDVFSVGATMFRILSGRPVHPGRDLVEALRRVASEPAPRLATVAPGVPVALAAVVDAALAFDPQRRYPDARAMQEDVRSVRCGEAPRRARALEDPAAEAPTRAAASDPPAGEPLRAERLVGKTLQGGYVLGRLLGRGGMGAVYESTTPEGASCAVKVILEHADAEGSNAAERFRREASLAAKIVHPNVVRTLAVDVDQRAGHPYFVMERIVGRDLASWVRETGPLEGGAVVRVFLQACRGV
ncbi:MAG: protein kinase, partial [Deltaproteobacteria bacterium]|nr:protein kinase [Deltaproteobacteria bacterium]